MSEIEIMDLSEFIAEHEKTSICSECNELRSLLPIGVEGSYICAECGSKEDNLLEKMVYVARKMNPVSLQDYLLKNEISYKDLADISGLSEQYIEEVIKSKQNNMLIMDSIQEFLETKLNKNIVKKCVCQKQSKKE